MPQTSAQPRRVAAEKLRRLILKRLATDGPAQPIAFTTTLLATRGQIKAALRALADESLVRSTELGWVATETGKAKAATYEVEEQRPAKTRRCLWTYDLLNTNSGGKWACARPALVGGHFCAQHLAELRRRQHHNIDGTYVSGNASCARWRPDVWWLERPEAAAAVFAVVLGQSHVWRPQHPAHYTLTQVALDPAYGATFSQRLVGNWGFKVRAGPKQPLPPDGVPEGYPGLEEQLRDLLRRGAA